MKKNEIYCLSVTGTTSEGLGVAKQDGLVIFIQGAIAGEMAEAKILKVKKNIAYAKVEKILTPSASRIRPSCPVFHQCGGCSYLHVSYEKQLEIKRQKVTDCLKRIGKIEFPVSGTLPFAAIRQNPSVPPSRSMGIHKALPRYLFCPGAKARFAPYI